MKRCKKCGLVEEFFIDGYNANGRYVPNRLMVGQLSKTPQRVSRGDSVDVSPNLISAPICVTTYTTNPNESKYW